MIQALYTFSLCALSAFHMLQPAFLFPVSSLSSEPVSLRLESSGPGILRFEYDGTWQTLEPDSQTTCALPAGTVLRLEAIAEADAQLRDLKINEEEQADASGMAICPTELTLSSSTRIEAVFARLDSDPSSADETAGNAFKEQKTMDDKSSLSEEAVFENPDREGSDQSEPDALPSETASPLDSQALSIRDGLENTPLSEPSTRFSSRMKARSDLRQETASAASSSLTITRRTHYSQVSVFDGAGTISNYLWTLSNNVHAFCGRFIDASPPEHAVSVSVQEVNDPAVRKVLYYGFNGPGNLLDQKDLSEQQQVVLTNDLVSQAYSGICISKDEPGINFWTGKLETIWKQIQSQPDPLNYKAYVAHFSGQGINHRNLTSDLQPLLFGMVWTPPPDSPPAPTVTTGSFMLLKSMQNPIVANTGYQNYSLAGAQYGLYKDAACKEQAAILTINENEESQVYTGTPGTYWLKELRAPKGFALDSTVKKVEIPAGSTPEAPARMIVYDQPQYAPIDVLVEKVDSRSGQPSALLEGAVFKITYYAADPSTPASRLQDSQRRGIWEMKTDQNGQIRTETTTEYFESTTDLIRVDGKAVFPIGVVTIQEIKAPSGYRINDTLYTVPITGKNSPSSPKLEVFQAPTIPNRPLELTLIKEDGKTMARLKEAEFTLKSPSGKSLVLRTDANGAAKVDLDENGIWSLQETKAPPGYQINPKPVQIHATSTGVSASCPEEGDTIVFSNMTLRVQDIGDGWALKIRKTDQYGRPLAGAVFKIYENDAMDKEIASATTQADGIAVFSNLETRGVLAEVQAPEGCALPLAYDGKPKRYYISKINDDIVGFVVLGMDPDYMQIVDKNSSDENWSVEEEGNLPILVFHAVNEASLALPQTGGPGHFWPLLTASLFLSGAWALKSARRHLPKKSFQP